MAELTPEYIVREELTSAEHYSEKASITSDPDKRAEMATLSDWHTRQAARVAGMHNIEMELAYG